MSSPQSILKEIFGYDSFRPLQGEVIENVLAHRDTLAVMPTGGGKSLCYQIPALLMDGLCVVVSPLISLMKDQVEQLQAVGIPAVFLNSSLEFEQYQENMQSVRSGRVRLLYVAPETLLAPRILDLLSKVNLDILTIDEAHCISEWGHDFRPEYRQLAGLRSRFPNTVCLALTATATARVRTDIKNSLGFAQSNEFVASFDRKNLFIEVQPKRDAPSQVVHFLDKFKQQSGIIYCFSRRQVDELAFFLEQRGYSVRAYHAGLEDLDRRRNQEAFIRDDAQIIVATIAFGMGINKPDVRFVVHYDLPRSIEGYYQEIGRAGRDGLPAHCLLLYSYSDVAKLKYFVDQKNDLERQVALQHLDAMVRFAEDEVNCRRIPLLKYFGESYNAPNCKACDNCTAASPPLEDVTIHAHKFLSCVRHTGERFGAAYISDVLLGSRGERILRLGHNRLPEYGAGRGLEKSQWMRLARQLVQMGLLVQESEYRTLSLSPKGQDALHQNKPVQGQLQDPQEPRPTKTGKQEEQYNHALFALLRARRKELADAAAVPPYVIFSDRTLIEMAAYYPQSLQRLLEISGVGQVKARQYGESFLEILVPFCEKHRLKEKSKKVRSSKTGLGGRTALVGSAYNSGESVAALMARFHVRLATILAHLTRYVEMGNRLVRSDELMSLSAATPDQQADAFSAFDELGTHRLKPVFDKLHGNVSYDELHILKLCYLCGEV
jgi:ATP-dependent DNA helicase RecQ